MDTLPTPTSNPEQTVTIPTRAIFGIIAIFAFLVLSALAVGYMWGKDESYKIASKPVGNQLRSCTEEAKVCPDGSTVVRTGAKCEFAPCPTIMPQYDTANWKKYESNDKVYSLLYPAEFNIATVAGKVEITNGLNVSVQTMKPETIVVDNFALTIERKTGSLSAVMKGTSPEEGEIVIDGRSYPTAYSGVEGTGIRTYYIDLGGNRWLVVSHHQYNDDDITDTDKADTKFLNTQQQVWIIEKMISTFTSNN